MARHSFGPFSYVGSGRGNRTYELRISKHLILLYGHDAMKCCRTLAALIWHYKHEWPGYFCWKYQPAICWGTDQVRQDILSTRELWNMLWERLKCW